MPTENRSNTEMVSVPFQREGRYIVIKLSDLAKVPSAVGEPFAEQLTAIQRRLPERECLVIESDWPEYGPAWAAIEARITGKPAQHRGEPVALPDRKLHVHQGLSHTDAEADGWNACLDEIAKLGLLYTHSDPDEVERLRGIIRMHEKTVQEQADHLAYMRAQLAERDALLRDLEGKTILSWPDKRRISAALSASAERNQCDGCQAGIPLVNGTHRMGKPEGYADTMSCQAGRYASAEPSAPVGVELVETEVFNDPLYNAESDTRNASSLLEEVLEWFDDGVGRSQAEFKLMRKIGAWLGRSVPSVDGGSDECAHSYANKVGCPECGEEFGAEPNPPKCKYCGDTGQIMVGRSGDASDGNAPILEPCEDCDRGAPKCETCNGTGMVDDGEITCSEGGIPYENGPVKCVKDCPDCTASAPVERDDQQDLRDNLSRMIGQAEYMLELAENSADPEEDEDDGSFDECRKYIEQARAALERKPEVRS